MVTTDASSGSDLPLLRRQSTGVDLDELAVRAERLTLDERAAHPRHLRQHHPHRASTLGVASRKSVAAVLHDGAVLAAGGDEAKADLAALREQWSAWHNPDQSACQRIAATTSLDDDGWFVRCTIP